VILPCIKRSSRLARVGDALNHVGGWRIGLGSRASVESFSYGLPLLWRLGGYDVVHLQQGSLALFLNRARKFGLLRPPFIFANGQLVDPEFLSGFPYVQHLSPYVEELMRGTVKTVLKSFVIPNFVDTDRFIPGDKKQARTLLNMPLDAFVVLSVGTIKKQHKRMDYFLSEAARLRASEGDSYHFVIAGGKTEETFELEELGRQSLGDSLVVYTDLPFEKMPLLYKAADVFALCSLAEACPMVLIEALASGVPVICNRHPIMAGMISEGGETVNLRDPGSLAEALRRHRENPALCAERGRAGRERALKVFSKEVVIGAIMEMYKSVMVAEQCGKKQTCHRQ
jgi:glycosyltransferase involved in cell wall biosynthesis